MAKPIKCGDKWRIRWNDETGVRRSAVFETYKEAEYQLDRRRAATEEIKRGVRRAEPMTRRFDELCDRWLIERVPEKRSGRDDRSMIRRHLRPAFGHRTIISIDGGAMRADYVRRKLKDGGAGAPLSKKTVNNHLTLLIAMLNYAKDALGWLRSVPRISKLTTANDREDFRCLRSHGEIRRLLAAARAEGEHVSTLYASAVYTGMRAGELAALRWSNVDLDRRQIKVTHSFDGPTKSNRIRVVPIMDPLLPILRRWKLRHPGKLVFTSQAGTMHGKSARIFQEVLHRTLERASFPRVEHRGKLRRYITFHDLRHTFASQWVMNGGDIYRLQKILGHRSIETTQRYAHLEPEVFSQDYGRLGTASKEPAVVIPIRPANRVS